MKYLLFILLMLAGCASTFEEDIQTADDRELECMLNQHIDSNGDESKIDYEKCEKEREQEELYEKMMRRSHIYRHPRAGI